MATLLYYMADSRFAPSQWETPLLCKDVFHWLGANLEFVLYYNYITHAYSGRWLGKWPKWAIWSTSCQGNWVTYWEIISWLRVAQSLGPWPLKIQWGLGLPRYTWIFGEFLFGGYIWFGQLWWWIATAGAPLCTAAPRHGGTWSQVNWQKKPWKHHCDRRSIAPRIILHDLCRWAPTDNHNHKWEIFQSIPHRF